jgi:hypothetical protein
MAIATALFTLVVVSNLKHQEGAGFAVAFAVGLWGFTLALAFFITGIYREWSCGNVQVSSAEWLLRWLAT